MDGHADQPPATTLAAAPPVCEPAVLAGIVADPGLSFGAKGMALWALTRPPGHVLTRAELSQASRDPLHVLARHPVGHRAAPEVRVAHVHHRVGRSDPAGLPHPGQWREQQHGGSHPDDHPRDRACEGGLWKTRGGAPPRIRKTCR